MARKTEYVDIVDGLDRVVGRDSHERVHDWNVGLLHRAVHAVLMSSNGKVFIQQRSWSKRLAPGKWDWSVGEHVKSGESYDQAVRRGLKEELGISKKILLKRVQKRLIEDIRKGTYDNKEMSTLYEGIWEGKMVLSDETAQAKWFTIAQLKKMAKEHPKKFTPFFLNHFKEWVKTRAAKKAV